MDMKKRRWIRQQRNRKALENSIHWFSQQIFNTETGRFVSNFNEAFEARYRVGTYLSDLRKLNGERKIRFSEEIIVK